MSDDLLRRAADRVRYLAGDPDDWDADSHDWETWEVRAQDRRGWWSRPIGHTRRATVALHVAAWSPRTAHLVADMLACASSVPERDRDGIAYDRCGTCGTAHLTEIAQSLLNHPEENGWPTA